MIRQLNACPICYQHRRVSLKNVYVPTRPTYCDRWVCHVACECTTIVINRYHCHVAEKAAIQAWENAVCRKFTGVQTEIAGIQGMLL